MRIPKRKLTEHVHTRIGLYLALPADTTGQLSANGSSPSVPEFTAKMTSQRLRNGPDGQPTLQSPFNRVRKATRDSGGIPWESRSTTSQASLRAICDVLY